MSKASIRIPAPLRSYTGGTDEVHVECDTAGEALTILGEVHAGILEKLLDERGELRSFVNLYIGERNIRSLSGLASPVAQGDVLSIVPAVAGGRP
jgi:molybdopterin converting factor small subunit